MDGNQDNSYKFYRIASLSDIPAGERLFFELEGNPIVIFAIDGSFFATGDVCSHDQGSIGEGEIVDDEIVCPRHGARFNLKTGKVLSFPAVVDIPVYPVRIVDNFIEVGIPGYKRDLN